MTIKTKNRIPPFSPQSIEKIAQILGKTSGGLSGSEIGNVLASCKIPDWDSQNTKWRRLYNAFAKFSNEHQCGNHVVTFINHVMSPISHTDNPEGFNNWCRELNKVLVFEGMEIGSDGKIKKAPKAITLDEAIARVARLKEKLEKRGVHPAVLQHCVDELKTDNYFHAVLEAMKSIAVRVRQLSGVDGDGAPLIQAVFSGDTPKLRINEFKTKTQTGEQRGFVSLLTGMYGMFRNPTAHAAKIEWTMSEQDALDIMSTISFVHRKLDFVNNL